MEEVYIPKVKIRTLRKNFSIVREIELKTECEISFDKEENCIRIKGKDAFAEYTAKEVIFAYGRGFSVKDACKLMNEEIYIKVINFKEYTKNKDRIKLIKSRIIGTEGRAKVHIEGVSSAIISVYGNTVSIIGDVNAVRDAETAVATIIGGGSHRSAYTRMDASHRTHKKID